MHLVPLKLRTLLFDGCVRLMRWTNRNAAYNTPENRARPYIRCGTAMVQMAKLRDEAADALTGQPHGAPTGGTQGNPPP
jgi:hypothetical protein